MTRARDIADQQKNLGGAVAPFVGGKNAVINGAFDFWQRGTSFASGAAPIYTADRWAFNRSGGDTNATVSRQTTSDTTNLPGIQYCARVQRNNATSATTGPAFWQSFETVNSIPYAGRVVTFSFYARAGANFSSASNLLTAALYTGTGTDQNLNVTGYVGQAQTSNNASLTTTWQRFSYQASIPAATTEIGFIFSYTPVGTAGAADFFEITGVQLEAGSQATPFSRAGGSIGGELALCQRYYFRVNAFATSQYAVFGAGAGNSATQARTVVPFPVTMRIKPSAIDYPTLGSSFSIIAYDDSMNVAPTGLILDGNQSDTQSGYLLWNTSSGVVANRPCVVRGLATTGAYVGFTAEL